MVNINHGGTIHIQHDHYFHGDPLAGEAMTQLGTQVQALTQQVQTLVEQNTLREAAMNVRLDHLASSVQHIDDAEVAAEETMHLLADQVRALEPTQQAIEDFANHLDATAAKIAASVVANTPVENQAPAPEPAPGTLGGGTAIGGGAVSQPPVQPVDTATGGGVTQPTDTTQPVPPPGDINPSGGADSGTGSPTGETGAPANP